MDQVKLDEIEEVEIAVQAAAEKAIVNIDGEKMSFVDGLKVLRTKYGVGDDFYAKKATYTGNVIQTLEFFTSQTFKSPEQRKAEKDASEAQQSEMYKEELANLLYKKEMSTLTTKEKARLVELKGFLAPEQTTTTT